MAQTITFREAGGGSASTVVVKSYYGKGCVNVKDVLAQFGVETLRYKDKKGVWRPLEPGGRKRLSGLSRDKFKVGDVVEVDFQDSSPVALPVARQISSWVKALDHFSMFLIGCLAGCAAVWAFADQRVRPISLTSLFDLLITFFLGCFCGCFFGCVAALAVMAPRFSAEQIVQVSGNATASSSKPTTPTRRRQRATY